MHSLEFHRTHRYSANVPGITIPVSLTSGSDRVDVMASIDTGASNCLFSRQFGEMLSLRLEHGEPKTFRTAAGSVETFGHIVRIDTFDLHFESMVYFFADGRIQKNLLGRSGWLDRVRIGLIEYDQMLYLASYDYQ